MVIRSMAKVALLGVALAGAIVLAPATEVFGWVFSQALAQTPAKPQRQQFRGWLQELQLSPDQLQKIRQIRSQYQGRLVQLRQAVQQGQQELKTLMAGNASSEQVRQKFEQVKRLQEDLLNTRIESMLAIRQVLNPEQRQKLAELMRQRGNGLREL